MPTLLMGTSLIGNTKQLPPAPAEMFVATPLRSAFVATPIRAAFVAKPINPSQR